MKPTAREVPITARRSGVHFLTLAIGSQQWTGHETELAALADEIRKALQQNGISQ